VIERPDNIREVARSWATEVHGDHPLHGLIPVVPTAADRPHHLGPIALNALAQCSDCIAIACSVCWPSQPFPACAMKTTILGLWPSKQLPKQHLLKPHRVHSSPIGNRALSGVNDWVKMIARICAVGCSTLAASHYASISGLALMTIELFTIIPGGLPPWSCAAAIRMSHQFFAQRVMAGSVMVAWIALIRHTLSARLVSVASILDVDCTALLFARPIIAIPSSSIPAAVSACWSPGPSRVSGAFGSMVGSSGCGSISAALAIIRVRTDSKRYSADMPAAPPNEHHAQYLCSIDAPEPQLQAWSERLAPEMIPFDHAGIRALAHQVGERAKRWFIQQRLLAQIAPDRIRLRDGVIDCDWLTEPLPLPTDQQGSINLDAVELNLLPQLIDFAERAPSWKADDWHCVERLSLSAQDDRVQLRVNDSGLSRWHLYLADLPLDTDFNRLQTTIAQAAGLARAAVDVLPRTSARTTSEPQLAYHQTYQVIAELVWPETLAISIEAISYNLRQGPFDHHAIRVRETVIDRLDAFDLENLLVPSLPPIPKTPLTPEQTLAIFNEEIGERGRADYDPGFQPVDFGIKY
jgi:hypothetical protein